MIEACPTGYRPRSKTATFSVVVETAKDALAKLAELAESEQTEVAAMDLSGTLIDLATLQASSRKAGPPA